MDSPFDILLDRRGTDSYKWDSAADADVLPMWVADMDFATAPVVAEALRKRVEHPVFGYTRVPDAYFQSVSDWFTRRHNWLFPTSLMLYTSGVVPALSAVIKALTQPGDEVIVQSPVFNCFYSSIRNNGCTVVSNELLYDGHTYHIDFDDLERKASSTCARLLLLCNPHNPVDRVWTREELLRIGDICLRNDVWVVADEIHCEFVSPGHSYIPYGSLSPELMHRAVVCLSPSKAFNLAGLQIANIVCDDADVRQRIDKALNINEVCDVNPFGVVATRAAYSDEGARWLEELNAYIYANYLGLLDFFRRELPQFPVTELEGTYLVWVDCSVTGKSSELIEEHLLRTQHVWVNAGTMYGAGGNHFIRINIACPRRRMLEGLRRIAAGLQSLLP